MLTERSGSVFLLSVSTAWNRPLFQRPNLETRERLLVTKVLFEGKKAVGVEYQDKNGETKQVRD